MIRIALLIFVFIAFADFVEAKSPTKKAAKEPGWMLVQTSSMYGKNIKICATKTNFKWRSEDLRMSLVMTKPNWDVKLFNDRSKKIISMPAEQFEFPFHKKSLNFMGIYPKRIPFKFFRTEKKFGLNVSRYVARSINKFDNLSEIIAADLWVTKDLELPAKVDAVMKKVNSMPNLGGVLIQFGYQRKPGRSPKTPYRTLVFKRLMIEEAVFSIPKGYKMCKTVEEVHSDQTGVEGLDWLMH